MDAIKDFVVEQMADVFRRVKAIEERLDKQEEDMTKFRNEIENSKLTDRLSGDSSANPLATSTPESKKMKYDLTIPQSYDDIENEELRDTLEAYSSIVTVNPKAITMVQAAYIHYWMDSFPAKITGKYYLNVG